MLQRAPHVRERIRADAAAERLFQIELLSGVQPWVSTVSDFMNRLVAIQELSPPDRRWIEARIQYQTASLAGGKPDAETFLSLWQAVQAAGNRTLLGILTDALDLINYPGGGSQTVRNRIYRNHRSDAHDLLVTLLQFSCPAWTVVLRMVTEDAAQRMSRVRQLGVLKAIEADCRQALDNRQQYDWKDAIDERYTLLAPLAQAWPDDFGMALMVDAAAGRHCWLTQDAKATPATGAWQSSALEMAIRRCKPGLDVCVELLRSLLLNNAGANVIETLLTSLVILEVLTQQGGPQHKRDSLGLHKLLVHAPYLVRCLLWTWLHVPPSVVLPRSASQLLFALETQIKQDVLQAEKQLQIASLHPVLLRALVVLVKARSQTTRLQTQAEHWCALSAAIAVGDIQLAKWLWNRTDTGSTSDQLLRPERSNLTEEQAKMPAIPALAEEKEDQEAAAAAAGEPMLGSLDLVIPERKQTGGAAAADGMSATQRTEWCLRLAWYAIDQQRLPQFAQWLLHDGPLIRLLLQRQLAASATSGVGGTNYDVLEWCMKHIDVNELLAAQGLVPSIIDWAVFKDIEAENAARTAVRDAIWAGKSPSAYSQCAAEDWKRQEVPTTVASQSALSMPSQLATARLLVSRLPSQANRQKLGGVTRALALEHQDGQGLAWWITNVVLSVPAPHALVPSEALVWIVHNSPLCTLLLLQARVFQPEALRKLRTHVDHHPDADRWAWLLLGDQQDEEAALGLLVALERDPLLPSVPRLQEWQRVLAKAVWSPKGMRCMRRGHSTELVTSGLSPGPLGAIGPDDAPMMLSASSG